MRSSPVPRARTHPQSAVSSLRYHGGGALLASGGRDTDVIVWDVVGETGLYRLRGHKDQVTDLVSGAPGRKAGKARVAGRFGERVLSRHSLEEPRDSARGQDVVPSEEHLAPHTVSSTF